MSTLFNKLNLREPRKFPCPDPEACPHFYNEFRLHQAYEQLQAKLDRVYAIPMTHHGGTSGIISKQFIDELKGGEK